MLEVFLIIIKSRWDAMHGGRRDRRYVVLSLTAREKSEREEMWSICRELMKPTSEASKHEGVSQAARGVPADSPEQ